MDRTRFLLVCAVIVTVGALALGAPSLTELDQQGDNEDGSGEGSPAEDTVEQEGDGFIYGEGNQTNEGEQRPSDPGPIVLLGILLSVILLLAITLSLGPARLLKGFLVAVILFLILGPILSATGVFDIFTYLLENIDYRPPGFGDKTGQGTDETAGETTEDGGQGSATSVAFSAGTVFALLLGALLGVALLYRNATEQTDEPTEFVGVPEDDRESVTVDTLGRAAGRATAVAEDPPSDNIIYRAWVEMTTALDVEARATLTPKEFQTRAVDAGLDRSHAAELTDLFRTVRYGDQPATEAQKTRARAILDDIEQTYGPGDTDNSSVEGTKDSPQQTDGGDR